MMPSHQNSRRGVTLLEVMIAIGILAIGLTSVMSLIPAGKSEAGKAVVLDRAATIATNALADAVTYGLTRPDSIVITGTGNVIVFDPVNTLIGFDPANTLFANAGAARIRTGGVLSSGATHPAADNAILKLVTQGRDDVVYTPSANEDDAPRNQFTTAATGPSDVASANVRAFDGRMTCLISLAKIDATSTAALTTGDQARLSVIVFHNRDVTNASATTVTGSYDAASGTITIAPSQIPADRTLKQTIRPGTIVYDSKKTLAPEQSRRWSQVVMASINDNTATPTVYVTFAGTAPRDGDVQIVLDTVGMAEKVVRLEGPNSFGW
jgi:prepilin-type N-terminal cleavage/methylation domain-containing protein